MVIDICKYYFVFSGVSTLFAMYLIANTKFCHSVNT